MKRILLASAVLTAATTTSAFAADIAPQMYSKAPAAMPIVYNWTGFYVGGNVGYGWGKGDTLLSFANFGPIDPLNLESKGKEAINLGSKSKGVIGGGTDRL